MNAVIHYDYIIDWPHKGDIYIFFIIQSPSILTVQYAYLHAFAYVGQFLTSMLTSDKCKQCGSHLHNHLPPTWREFRFKIKWLLGVSEKK